MKTLVLALLAVIVAVPTATYAQAQQKQTRSVGSFEAVQAGGGIDVVLTQAATAAVVVETTPEAQQHLRTTVENGTLRIGWENGFSWKDFMGGQGRKATVFVSCPHLISLGVSGGADAKSSNSFTADSFTLSASGGADVHLSLKARALTSSASGGGEIYVTGTAERQTVTVSSGSEYHAYGLQSTTASAQVSSGGDAELNVSGELAARASSGGGITYRGGARVSTTQTSSGGSVRAAR